MATPIAVLDACVFYPAPLRDLCMHLHLADLFQPKWTNEIHEEWIRNVLKNRPDLKKSQLNRTRQLMDTHSLDCLTDGYQNLIPKVTLPDLNDCHVLAAAIHSTASLIITFNLKDFPKKYLNPYKINAIHPDDFLVALFLENMSKFSATLKKHRLSLKNPPKSINAYIETLEQQKLPKLTKLIKKNTDLLY